jgi:phospholipid transport system substrate-binding protein
MGRDLDKRLMDRDQFPNSEACLRQFDAASGAPAKDADEGSNLLYGRDVARAAQFRQIVRYSGQAPDGAIFGGLRRLRRTSSRAWTFRFPFPVMEYGMRFPSLARACMALGLALALIVPLGPSAADTPAGDQATRQVTAFTSALLDTMRQARQLGINGRFNQLKPVVEETFDLSTMTRLAVGTAWATVPAADQQALTEAFERMTLASYARNFDDYSGEKFVVDPNVQTRGTDRLVSTTLVRPKDTPIPMIYRMRETQGNWKIVDIYLNGYVSELATRRSDFAATMAAGGSSALIKRINALSDKLLAGV